MQSAKLWLSLGCVWAGLGITLGAFGAHALESALPQWYPELSTRERMRQIWETAVRYQMFQAFGLLLFGIWNERRPQRASGFIALALWLGSLIFSGCLYALVLTNVRVLGAIVPIGGVLMILGWAMWAWQVAKEKPDGGEPSGLK
jgi:uncharacterized membrane protein YgdD (TMEM256/DUF423 family)